MSQVVVFHGSGHRAGCTMAAQSVAELIAREKKELTVLFAALNGRTSSEFMNESAVTIDEFKIRLKSGIGVDKNVLSPDRKTGNLYIIAGIEKEEEARSFVPDMAEVLLSSLQGKFDLIIVDSGSELDSGLAFGALRANSIKYLVFEQAESSIRRYEKMNDMYGKLNIEFDKFILSKYIEDDPLTVNYMSSRLSINKSLFFCVAHDDRGRISEIEHRTLLDTGSDRYRTDMLAIANDVVLAMNLEKINMKRKRIWNSFI